MAHLRSPILFYVNALPTLMPPTSFDQMLKDTYLNTFTMYPHAFAYILQVNRQLPSIVPNMQMTEMGLKICHTQEEFFEQIEVIQPYEIRIFQRDFFIDQNTPMDA